MARLPGTGETRSYRLEPNRWVEQVRYPARLRNGRVILWPVAPRPLVELRRDQYRRVVKQVPHPRLDGQAKRSQLPNTGQSAVAIPIVPWIRIVQQAFFPYWTLGGRVTLDFPQEQWESTAVAPSCPDVRRDLPESEGRDLDIPAAADGFVGTQTGSDLFPGASAAVADALDGSAAAADGFSSVAPSAADAFASMQASADGFASAAPTADVFGASSSAADQLPAGNQAGTDSLPGKPESGDGYSSRREECK